MSNIVVSILYETISYNDILNELGFIFDNKESSINDFASNYDIRWDYHNFCFTDDISYGIKLIGVSRIDGSLLFMIDTFSISKEIVIIDVFSSFNMNFKTLNKKLSFKEFIRKTKINHCISNTELPKKILINSTNTIKLVGDITDHLKIEK